ncbi:TasA family protein [Nocardioides solisilvae]|uniref:TasA family protein n=1 Tax=Nocardioides solisilvae TaxID=1542435 RepID=UPI000D74874A|nr:TasA family protein [Nocardioides solisilvae]
MRNTKKVLVPLATLLAAGAIAVGSGATFTSTTGNTISAVTSGTLTQANSKDGRAIFNLTDMKPGDTLNGTLTLTNTGSLPAKFSLTESSSATTFAKDVMTMTITDTTTSQQVFKGSFGDLVDGSKNALGEFAPGAARDFRFTVAMDPAAGNDQQGKAASATYTWDSVQLDATTSNQ